MIKTKKSTISIIVVLLTLCILMYYIEVFLRPTYFTKSFLKIILFGVLPSIYCLFNKNIKLKDIFKIYSRKQLLGSFLLSLGVYVFIIATFLLLKNFINLNDISFSLGESLNVNKDNFIYIALYISFINSLLEEFFFRGFVFFSLKNNSSRILAYTISALSFSLYHIAIILNWFNIILFFLVIIGLFIAGLLFNWLNEKSNNIYNSWLVHMFANFSINSIGFFMFYLNY